MLRVAVCAAFCCLVGCSTPERPTPTAAPNASAPGAHAAYALHVKGMGCPLCATNVRKSIERVPGVDAVNIDLGAGVVKVSARLNLTPEETSLRKAVADAGFELSKVEKL